MTCKDELVAEAGKTASCDVALSETNNVEAVVTVTVKDGELSYETSPALSKEQLAQAVSGMTGASTVVCPTGLEGKIGATAQCDTTADGVAAKRLVEVDNVSGLEMDVSMKKVWSKEQVQGDPAAEAERRRHPGRDGRMRGRCGGQDRCQRRVRHRHRQPEKATS